VQDPRNYGVAEISPSAEIILIEETPNNPKSKFAILSLYFYDNSVISMLKDAKPSLKNELEISDLNLMYLDLNKLNVKILQRGTVWLDMGRADNLYAASSYVKTVQKRQGRLVSSIEEIAGLILQNWKNWQSSIKMNMANS